MKLKKVFVIFLTFIYLIIASGLTFNLHYCGGKISGISFWKNEVDNCCGEKKMAKKNCCNDKTTVLKINDIQYSSSSLKTPSNPLKIVDPVFTLVRINFNVFSVANLNSIVHDPPDLYQNPVYLQHRILLI